MKKLLVDVNIEITKDSNIKYEYDREKQQIVVDRILRDGFKYPANYGSLREALDWDGDELDVLVFSPEKFIPGSVLKARIVGAMKMIDDGETDTKLIAVHEDDYRLDQYQELKDIPEWWLKEVSYFFSNYKNWKKPGITSVEGFEDISWAIQEYEECVHLMNEYGKLPKKEFIKQMKEKHPEKYR